MKTMDLLAKALTIEPAPYWTKKLKLSRGAIHTAKTRGNLSPAIAGALAEELGEDAAAWMVIAALEGERESACKTRMIKKFIAGSALALASMVCASNLEFCCCCAFKNTMCIMSNAEKGKESRTNAALRKQRPESPRLS